MAALSIANCQNAINAHLKLAGTFGFEIPSLCFDVLRRCFTNQRSPSVLVVNSALLIANNYLEGMKYLEAYEDHIEIMVTLMDDLMNSYVTNQIFRDFFVNILPENGKTRLQGILVTLIETLTLHGAEQKKILRIVDVGLKVLPQELREPLLVRKAQIWNTQNDVFYLPQGNYTIYEQTSLSTRIACSMPKSKQQIKMLESILENRTSDTYHDTNLRLLLECSYRGVCILDFVPTSTSSGENFHIQLLDLEICMQKINFSDNGSQDALITNAYDSLTNLMNTMWNGLKAVDVTPQAVEAAEVPKKAKASGKEKKGPEKGSTVPAKIVDTELPKGDEWINFEWSEQSREKYAAAKSSAFCNAHSLQNPFWLLKTLLCLLKYSLGNHQLQRAHQIVTLASLVGRNCNPDIGSSFFAMVRQILRKSAISPSDVSERIEVAHDQERYLTSTSNNDWDMECYLNMLFIKCSCYMELDNIESARLIAYQMIRMANNANLQRQLSMALCYLSAICLSSGNVQGCFKFATQAMDIDEAECINSPDVLRCFVYAKSAICETETEVLQELEASLHYVSEATKKAGDDMEKKRAFQLLACDISMNSSFFTGKLSLSSISDKIGYLIGNIESSLQLCKLIRSGAIEKSATDILCQMLSLCGQDHSLLKCAIYTTGAFLICKQFMAPSSIVEGSTKSVIEEYLEGLDKKQVLETLESASLNSLDDCCENIQINSASTNAHHNFFSGFLHFIKWKKDASLGSEARANERKVAIDLIELSSESIRSEEAFAQILAQALVELYEDVDDAKRFRYLSLLQSVSQAAPLGEIYRKMYRQKSNIPLYISSAFTGGIKLKPIGKADETSGVKKYASRISAPGIWSSQPLPKVFVSYIVHFSYSYISIGGYEYVICRLCFRKVEC